MLSGWLPVDIDELRGYMNGVMGKARKIRIGIALALVAGLVAVWGLDAARPPAPPNRATTQDKIERLRQRDLQEQIRRAREAELAELCSRHPTAPECRP